MTDTDMTHHAILQIGRIIPEDLVAKYGVNDPDVQVLQHDRIGIEEVRVLKYDAHQRPVHATHRTFVLVPKEITREAQNALLKLFEDLPLSARFKLYLEREDILIPTLRSRLHLEEGDSAQSDTGEAKAFLKLPYAERINLVQERAKAKDTTWFRTLTEELEQYVHGVRMKEFSPRDVVFVSENVRNRGASQKMLLEHLALSLPVLESKN